MTVSEMLKSVAAKDRLLVLPRVSFQSPLAATPLNVDAKLPPEAW